MEPPRDIPRQDCTELLAQKCEIIPRESCRNVPRQVCRQVIIFLSLGSVSSLSDCLSVCQSFNNVALQVPRQQCSNVPRQECKQVIIKTVQTSVDQFSNLKSNRFLHRNICRCRGRSVSKSRGPPV